MPTPADNRSHYDRLADELFIREYLDHLTVENAEIPHLYYYCRHLNTIGYSYQYGLPTGREQGYEFLTKILKERTDLLQELAPPIGLFCEMISSHIVQHAYDEQLSGATTQLFETVLEIAPAMFSALNVYYYSRHLTQLPFALPEPRLKGFENINRIFEKRPDLKEQLIPVEPKVFETPAKILI